MNNPLVTIITSSFNAQSTIEQTINSVINQTYSNIQYIIIDGGSVDGTLNIIKSYQSRIDYWISEPDKGIYNAWNKALSVARGEWIAFLGADDLYLPDAIESYINYIVEHPDGNQLEFVSSKMEYVDRDLKLLNVIGKKWTWRAFSDTMVTIHCGSLHRNSFFSIYGKFDESFKSAGDYALLLKAGRNLRAGFLDKITVKMRKGGVSSDGFFLFKEVLKAKLDSNQVSRFSAYGRYLVGIAAFFLRRIVNASKRISSV